MTQFFSRPWDSQPQGSVNPDPSWQLDELWFPESGLATLQANVSIDVGATGRVWKNAASTNAGVMFLAGDELPLSECTVLLGGAVTTTVVNGEFGVANAVTNQRLGAHLPYTDNKVYWDFGGGTVGTTRLVTSGTVTRSERDVWALTVGPRGMEIWQNGILIASNTATPTRVATTADWGLGPQGTSSTSRAAGRWWMLGFSSKQASRGQLSMLRSPEAAFAELLEPRRIYIPAAAATGGTTYTQSASGSISGTGELSTSSVFSKTSIGSLSLSGLVFKQTSISKQGSVNFQGAINKGTDKKLLGNISSSGSILFSGSLEQASLGSVTPSGSLSLASIFSRAYSASITMTGAVKKLTYKTVTGIISATGALFKRTSKSFIGSITASGIASGFSFTPSPVTGVLATTVRHIRRFLGRR